MSDYQAEPGQPDSYESKPAADKNTPEAKKIRHQMRMSWLIAEAARQASNRAIMAKCEDYYDSKQYEQEDIDELEARGQKPVCYNEIFPTINFLIGTERRSRVDFVVVAEDDDEASGDDAIVKTKLLKYLDDVNLAPFERSYAADDSFKAGIGWLEVGLRGDKTGVPIFVGAESWRNILWDSKGKRDLSDSRYLFRLKTVDLDIACAIFPDKEEELKSAAQKGDPIDAFGTLSVVGGIINGLDLAGNSLEASQINLAGGVDLFNPRERVTLIECWSREPVKRKASSDGLGDPVQFRIRVSIMTEMDTLLEAWSPFKHDRFPFIPVWAYRHARTGLPYSPVYPLLGPQEALNHRMSRSLYEASSNQMEIEVGAIDTNEGGMTIEELRDEWSDPNGVAVYANGAISGQKVRQKNNAGAAQQQLVLAEQDRQSLRATGSVNEENRGLRSTATSRVAMDAKAERGSVGTAELFDNQLLARQFEGEITLSLAEQFIVQPMTVRVAGEQGSGKFDRTKINEPQADGTYLNDISARRAHFVVGEQAWKQSYAEAAFGSLMEVMTQLASAAPQVVVALLDVVFDMHPNLPRKRAILDRIREVNGQTDPDGKITPEQQAARAQKAAVAKAQYEAQMAGLQAEIKEKNAKGEKLDADKILTRITALYEAAQAALVLAQQPGVTPIADQLLASAGFVDQTGSPNTIDASQVQPIAQPVQAAAPAVGAAGPELRQADGAAQGIETPGADGAQPQVPPAAQPQGAM